MAKVERSTFIIRSKDYKMKLGVQRLVKVSKTVDEDVWKVGLRDYKSISLSQIFEGTNY